MFRLGSIFAVIGAIALALVVWLQTHDESQRSQQVTTPGNSDYYMTGAVIHQLSDAGELIYRMKIERILHYPDDSARLEDINLHYVKGTDTYWDLLASRGYIPPENKSLYLHEGVTIYHPRDNDNLLKAQTPYAWIYPEDKRIDTQAHVVSTEPGQRVDGDGMHINLDKNEIKLKQNVRVTYE